MRKKISVYWPLALIVPFAAIAWMHAWHTAAEQMPLGADKLSAELARAVSYGLVGTDSHAPGLKAMPAATDASSSRAI
jgi:hypothetical protein